MLKSDKERVVAELTERLRTSETLIVADYRGLTNDQIDGLRSKLIEHGARFSVVKNTLTRRAAEAAGADALLALLDGPSAIAFVESDGDPVAVAKALRDAATSTKVLAIRGGVLEGTAMSADEVENLAKLPPVDVLRAQVLGAIISPLTTVVALMTAPLRDLVGLIDARIEQLGGVASPADAEEAIGEGPAEVQAASNAETSGGDGTPVALPTDAGEELAEESTSAEAAPISETADDDTTPIAQPQAAREEENNDDGN
jgi:large subunit ribosomal protein L10